MFNSRLVNLSEVVSVWFEGVKLNLEEFKSFFGCNLVVFGNDYEVSDGVYGVVDNLSEVEGGYRVEFVEY